MDGLAEVTIRNVRVFEGFEEEIVLDVDCVIYNPSQVTMELGDTEFDLYHEQQLIGDVKMVNLILMHGTNFLNTRCHYKPNKTEAKALQAGQHLLSNFVTGIDSFVQIIGTKHSTNLSFLQSTVASLRLSSTMHGLKYKMLQEAFMIINPMKMINTMIYRTVPSKLKLFNPLDETITILAMKATVGFQGQTIGILDVDVTSNPVQISPKTSTLSQTLDLLLKINGSSVWALFDAAGGKLLVDVEADLHAMVGKYLCDLQYKQQLVSVKLS